MKNKTSKTEQPCPLHSVMLSSFSTENWKIYTPKDDPDVVVMEDYFGHKRTFDISAFDSILDAINSIQDY